MMQFQAFRIAARGLIRKDDKLLFVSDDGKYWYTPGGRLEVNETLEDCVKREVYEETGLLVKPGPLLYVQENFNVRDAVHAIHFYFATTILKGSLSETWSDDHGTVKYRRFFGLEDIKKHTYILPRFLATCDWEPSHNHSSPHYQGSVKMHGFEMLEELAT